MAKPRVSAGGGLPAMRYVLGKAFESGSPWQLYRRLRSRNACKTCAFGMGGQGGGMTNEAGHFPEVCKKSVQAQAADMIGAIDEGFFRATSLDDLARLTSAELERLGRVAFPLLAEEGDTHFHRIPWDEALERAADAFRAAAPDETFVYLSGRSSNEAAFLLQLVARAYGTAHIHNCSYYCHQPSGVALTRVYGSGTASVVLDDLARADLVMVIGANPASNHPRLITQLVRLRRRGGKAIVVNPLRELGLTRFRIPSDWRSLLFGSQVADLYLQPHVGADIALLKAILKGLIESGGVDQAFVAAHTSGWEEVRQDVEAVSWETLVATSGVPRAEIDRAVAMLRAARRGILCWAMGLTHHCHGVDNILAVANVALARGWLGRPGAGLLPIRGHSNVQGVSSMGVTPALKAAFADRLAEAYGLSLPDGPGHDTFSSMEAAHAGQVATALILGGNLFAANPDRRWAGEALRRIGHTVYVATKLNEGHVHGRARTTLILPALARDEEGQATTQESMFNYVRLSDGGVPAVAGEMRSEVAIVADLARRILPVGRFAWESLSDHAALRRAIARCVPGWEALAEIGTTHREFQVGGRTFHEPAFATADGKARFHVTPLPAFAVGRDEFRLMTLRSEGQFNSVVYDEEDLYRGNRRRDVVMMNGDDARRLGLREGDPVTVATEVGHLAVHVAIVDLPPSNLAMYYPEANALVPGRIDPASRTPAFKSVVARIEPR
jgi:molybdopterin-dependent oxidoreductase alpha subunit